MVTPKAVLTIRDGGDELAMIAQLGDIARGLSDDRRPTFPLELEEPEFLGYKIVPVLLSLVGYAEDLSTRRPHTWFITGSIPDTSLVSNDWLVPYRLFRGIYNPLSGRATRGSIEPHDTAWPDLRFATLD
jgi:hypothetical protein